MRPIDPNVMFAKARMQRGIPALTGLGGFGSWANGIAFTSLGNDGSLFTDSGYDDGAGNVVYSQAALDRASPFEAVKRNPIPAAIAVGVGVLVVAGVLGMLGFRND